MNIASVQTQMQNSESTVKVKNLYTQKLTKDETKELRQKIVDNANAFTFKMSATQSNVLSQNDKFQKAYDEFQSFLKDIGYKDKPIAELSQKEAQQLVSQDGLFGVKATSQRIADFVIQGANGNIDLLRAGRDGMLQGFKEAQTMWGSKLPDISQKTMQKASELVNQAFTDLGVSALDTKV